MDTTPVLISNYEPQINDTFKSHDEFVDKTKSYACKLGFSVRLGKVEYLKKQNFKKIFRKRTLLCSKAGYSEKKEYNSDEEDQNIKERN